MTAFAPLAVANAVLDEAERQDKPVTLMQLLKLAYIAHGWSLGLLGEPLVNQQAQAWQHGPVYPAIYREFRKYGSGEISAKATDPFGQVVRGNLSAQQQDLVRAVVDAYGDMHAFSLSNITHQPGTPWSQVYKAGRSEVIPDGLVAAHYRHLAAERGAHV